jgi:hypothetical protein
LRAERVKFVKVLSTHGVLLVGFANRGKNINKVERLSSLPQHPGRWRGAIVVYAEQRLTPVMR